MKGQEGALLTGLQLLGPLGSSSACKRGHSSLWKLLDLAEQDGDRRAGHFCLWETPVTASSVSEPPARGWLIFVGSTSQSNGSPAPACSLSFLLWHYPPHHQKKSLCTFFFSSSASALQRFQITCHCRPASQESLEGARREADLIFGEP